jgi:hypothetical protein
VTSIRGYWISNYSWIDVKYKCKGLKSIVKLGVTKHLVEGILKLIYLGLGLIVFVFLCFRLLNWSFFVEVLGGV